MNYYFQAFKQYANFSGRASKKEFWMFFLFNYIAMSVLYFIAYNAVEIQGEGILMLPILYVLGTFIPNLAITVRRLHDVGKSGWMILVSLIPFAGAIWLLVLLCQDSIAAPNEYGANYTENEIYTEQVTTAINSNLCSHCNSLIDADTVFCENCGNKIQ